jgi:predicted amidohydrolase YtcJ
MQTIDLRGTWVLPGPFDAHAHVYDIQSSLFLTNPDLDDLEAIGVDGARRCSLTGIRSSSRLSTRPNA